MSWVSDTCWWLKMSYAEWVIRCFLARGVHKSRTRPCQSAQPRLLLLINSNLPTLCLMQCGSGWPVHCRPLPSVLHSRFNPPFSGGCSRGLKATLTPSGHRWYFNLKPLLCPPSINPCSDPHNWSDDKNVTQLKAHTATACIHMVIWPLAYDFGQMVAHY